MGTEEAEKCGAVGEVEWDGEGDGVFGVRKTWGEECCGSMINLGS